MADCEISNLLPIDNTVYVQLLQTNDYNTVRVLQGRVEIDRTIFHCGMHSHTSIVHNRRREYLFMLTHQLCQQLHSTGTLSIGSNVFISGVKKNSTDTRSITISGTATTDGTYEEDSIPEDDQSGSQSDFPDNEETQDDNVVADETGYFLNLRRGQKRQRFLSDSESDSEQNFEDTVMALDGTVWQRIRERPAIGRPPLSFREVSGPTAHAKRDIMSGKASSAFSVIIDHTIIENIKKYTEAEALRVLGTTWDLPIKKLYAFIGVLYARGAYQAKNVSISHLWNSRWGSSFFSNAMSRNAFPEILRFLRFDDRSQRIQRLSANKFALISDVWKKFIENC
ncbi:uncharacterized protein LOC124948568 [Vespa velutina]|uniref:uncharacterized protein LOC124948568 n=1 Tax=Vespa velutina TaxID=202808 RepID=UPI001FB3E94B|nr:uncharacterized protein LOC124948568 [Vespa velutina]